MVRRKLQVAQLPCCVRRPALLTEKTHFGWLIAGSEPPLIATASNLVSE